MSAFHYGSRHAENSTRWYIHWKEAEITDYIKLGMRMNTEIVTSGQIRYTECGFMDEMHTVARI